MKAIRLFCCVGLVLLLLTAAFLPGIALAQDEETVPEPTTVVAPPEETPTPTPTPEPTPTPVPTVVEMNPTYPTVESIAGSDFIFEITFSFSGPEARVFDLSTTVPSGWEVYMTPQYETDKKISSIRLEPSFGSQPTIRLVATAPFWPLPDPGRYPITVKAASSDVSCTTDLTAVVTAKYALSLVPGNSQYNTRARAGEAQIFSTQLQNLSTSTLENVTFSSTAPDGWEIGFSPDKVDLMDAISEQTVQVSITPPAKAIAGDYMITLQASGKQTTAQEIDVRVTVETPTIWGWVGVAIILVVVLGLGFVFMRFSRR